MTPVLVVTSLAATDADGVVVGPGFAGFVTIFLLAVATVLLARSMTKHLRKVRYSPDPAAKEPPGQGPQGAAGAAGRPGAGEDEDTRADG